MTTKKIDIVIQIVSKNCKINKNNFNINSHAREFDKWDSLAQVQILSDLEKKFKKKFNLTQMSKMNSIKSILEHIK